MKHWHVGREKPSPTSEPAVAFQLNLKEVHRKGTLLSPARLLGKVWQYHQGTHAHLQFEAEESALEASDRG